MYKITQITDLSMINVKYLRSVFFYPLSILFILLLTSCQQSIKNNLPPDILWQQHLAQLEKIDHFQAQGSFTYTSGQTKRYARFLWQQQSLNSYTLHITSTIGTRLAELAVSPDNAILTDNKGKRYHNDNVEYLLEQLTGIDIPLSYLTKLLIGLPYDTTQFALNQDGLLEQMTLSQNSNEVWSAIITRYKRKNHLMLPEKITLNHRDNTLQLRITNWKL